MREWRPWGKLADGFSHHLAHHCADVVACFLTLVTLPVIRSRLERAAGGPLSSVSLARLAVIVFLHDCGKLHPGFQAKGWPEGLWTGRPHGHVREGAEIFLNGGPDAIARNLHRDALLHWDPDLDLFLAALAHHGRPIDRKSVV